MPTAAVCCCKCSDSDLQGLPKVGLTRENSGAKGTRTPNPLLAKWWSGPHYVSFLPGQPRIVASTIAGLRHCCCTLLLQVPARDLLQRPQ
jgi:hypothetical protein